MANQMEYFKNIASKYLEVLQKEIESNEKEQNKLSKEIADIQNLMDQLKLVSERPEWPNSFIQVNSLAYIPATIIHTGEHYVKLGPEIYTLMSLKETISFLQRKIDRIQKVVDIFKIEQKQLEERSKLSIETSEVLPETQDMPLEVASDKGIAHRTDAGLYEVIEHYAEEEEKTFYKRRQQHRSEKRSSNNRINRKETTEDVDLYFARLDELEELEDLRKELTDTTDNSNLLDANVDKINDRNDIPERVKAVLRNSDIYENLMADEVIQQYYYQNITEDSDETSSVNVLNELIVKTLINEPLNCSVYNQVSDSFKTEIEGEKTDKCHKVSYNDLAASAFLDSIESDMQKKIKK